MLTKRLIELPTKRPGYFTPLRLKPNFTGCLFHFLLIFAPKKSIDKVNVIATSVLKNENVEKYITLRLASNLMLFILYVTAMSLEMVLTTLTKFVPNLLVALFSLVVHILALVIDTILLINKVKNYFHKKISEIIGFRNIALILCLGLSFLMVFPNYMPIVLDQAILCAAFASIFSLLPFLMVSINTEASVPLEAKQIIALATLAAPAVLYALSYYSIPITIAETIAIVFSGLALLLLAFASSALVIATTKYPSVPKSLHSQSTFRKFLTMNFTSCNPTPPKP